MQEGDLYKIGREYYLVAPLRDDMLEMLILAAAGTEDDEANGDMEPSIGTEDDLELGIDDEPHDDIYEGMEPSLGWANGSPQFCLDAGYSNGTIRESDGNPDDEPDSEAEEGDPGGSDMPLGEADIDAQRGRIASRWPSFSRGGRA